MTTRVVGVPFFGFRISARGGPSSAASLLPLFGALSGATRTVQRGSSKGRPDIAARAVEPRSARFNCSETRLT
jgi:hypothetical protein